MKTKRTSDLLQGFLLMLCSVVMLCFRSAITSYINIVLGIILIIMGLFVSFGYFHFRKYNNTNDHSFIIALILVSSGVFSIATPARSFIIIGILWGLISVLKGIFGINSQIGRMIKGEKFLFSLLSSALELVMGLILLIELSNEAMSHHVILLSFTLFAEGLSHFSLIRKD
ncbi:MAG: DUF308 domain-containing protein [Bullifex sp.]